MQYTIVTGMSGSGKTRVIRFLEDMGYFCIDNMPPVLIPKFSEMLSSVNGSFNNVALVIDIRVGDMINELIKQMEDLKSKGYDCTLLYLDASDETLVKRYKETRRSHPLENEGGGLLDAIKRERKMLKSLFDDADYVIDTSNMTAAQLLTRLKEIYAPASTGQALKVNVMAFGYKYGMPLDADLVFDVRCFPNPFYIDELKRRTGNDKEVQDYVMSFPTAVKFMEKLQDLMSFMIPLYIEEGKISLTIAIGCTGGKHRSVTMTNKLADYLKSKDYEVSITYRDLGKE
ncbi:MAG: RNase adapter RapZ [Clostridia bacterium]|nr:RNase adapter RapZ [Clostridia bacterium]MBQ2670161.1 RNase adapter RapZ [Clostridia bacterium]MBQ3462905.1 RNase adapter RapZ [Clostridia bacterium]MBQ6530511.1 RNase adapter RapZ [Clostridia bacterium]MBQ6558056.1 RNase adapter RapZ [Clostridia bacterium]